MSPQINLVLRSLIRNLATPNILSLGKIKINFVFTLAYSYICPRVSTSCIGRVAVGTFRVRDYGAMSAYGMSNAATMLSG